MAKGVNSGNGANKGPGKGVSTFKTDKLGDIQTGSAIKLGEALGSVSYDQMFSALFVTSRSQANYQSALALLDLNKKNKTHELHTFLQAVSLINMLEILTLQAEQQKLVFNKDKVHYDEGERLEKAKKTYESYFHDAIAYLASFNDEEYKLVGDRFTKKPSVIVEDFAIKSDDITFIDYLLSSDLQNKINRAKLENKVKDIFLTNLEIKSQEIFREAFSQRDVNGPTERGYHRDELFDQYFAQFLTTYIANPRYQLNDIKNTTLPNISTYSNIIFTGKDISDDMDYKGEDSYNVCDSEEGRKAIDALFHKLIKADKNTWKATIKKDFAAIVKQYHQ